MRTQKNKKYATLLVKLKKDLGKYSKRKTKLVKFIKTLNVTRKNKNRRR
jgi:hypothetical protein